MDPDTSRQDAAGPPAPRRIELDLRKELPWTWTTMLGILALVALAMCAFAAWYFGGWGHRQAFHANAFLVVVFVILGSVALPVLYWAPRRAAAIVRSSPDTDPEGLMRTVLARVGWLESTSVLVAAVQAMVRSGRTGVVVAVRQMGRHTPFRTLPSIGVPFEPLHLHDLATRIDALDSAVADAHTSPLSAVISKLDRTAKGQVHRSIPRRLSGQRAALNAWRWLAWLPLATVAFFSLYRLVTGSGDVDEWVCLVLLGVMLLGVSARFVGWRRDVLAVPGGLVFRSAGPTANAWRVHLCTAKDSNLCLVNQQGQQWMLIAVGGQRAYRRVLVESDAVAACQAWISPLPPPSPEQLSDLE